jgi:hypothetical protein
MDTVSEGNIIIAVIAILIYILIFTDIQLMEDFGTSPGTMIQLYAKGPQDQYLTGPPSVDTLAYDYDYPYLYPNRYTFDRVALPSYYQYRYSPYRRSPHRKYWRFLDEFPTFW